MIRSHEHFEPAAEGLLAELAAAAYRVALNHGLRGPFIDVELELWRELRGVLRGEPADVGEPFEARGRDEEVEPCLR